MTPFLLAISISLIEVVTFHAWHWPYRHLLPKQFRTMLLCKGSLKGLVLIGITFMLMFISTALAWVYVFIHTVFGIGYHFIWCKRNGINPITVQPREKYVLATSAWVERLIEIKKRKRLTDKE